MLYVYANVAILLSFSNQLCGFYIFLQALIWYSRLIDIMQTKYAVPQFVRLSCIYKHRSYKIHLITNTCPIFFCIFENIFECNWHISFDNYNFEYVDIEFPCVNGLFVE